MLGIDINQRRHVSYVFTYVIYIYILRFQQTVPVRSAYRQVDIITAREGNTLHKLHQELNQKQKRIAGYLELRNRKKNRNENESSYQEVHTTPNEYNHNGIITIRIASDL